MYPSIHPSFYLLWLWFSTRDDFAPRGHMTISEAFLAAKTGGGGAPDTWQVEAMDAPPHPTGPTDAPQQRLIQPQTSERRRLGKSDFTRGHISVFWFGGGGNEPHAVSLRSRLIS